MGLIKEIITLILVLLIIHFVATVAVVTFNEILAKNSVDRPFSFENVKEDTKDIYKNYLSKIRNFLT